MTLRDGAHDRRVAVGMPNLHIMARHRLMHRDVGDRARVVFTQERIRLLRTPAFGNGRDGVERLLPLVERTGESQ